MENEYREAVVAWALACLRGAARDKARSAVDKRAAKQPILEVTARFGIDALGRSVIELAYAVEHSLAVAKQARDASCGGGGLTVELLREVLGAPELDAVLTADRPLPAHALVTVGEGGAAAVVRLGPGLARRLNGDGAAIESLAPGVRLVEPTMGDRFVPSPRVIEVVKEELIGPEPRLVTIEGCGRGDALGLAVALARRVGRTVLVVDGAALAALPSTWALLAAARREADLEGYALLVSDTSELRGAWRAAAARPTTTSGGRPALVVFADAGKPRETAGIDGFRELGLVLHAPPVVSAPAAATPAPTEAPKPKEDDGYDHIRALATRDAERALGITRPTPPPPRPMPSVPPSAGPTTLPTATGAAAPAAAATPVEKPAAAAPVAAVATATPVEKPAAKAAEAPPPGKRRRSKKAMEHFGGEEEVAPPARARAAVAAPEPVAAAPSVAASAVAAPPGAALPAGVDREPTPEEMAASEKAPYVPVADNASAEEVARVSKISPNPKQRIELIERLIGQRSTAIVASLRHNAKSGHPGVRAAAEQAMIAIFGPNWNRAPPPAKPIVQPPRSDDDDRGPPGGF